MATNAAALERIWLQAMADPRRALEEALSPSDLQTLLLDVARTRAAQRRPADLMQRWRDDRYVRPAGVDPRSVAKVVAQLWDLLPAQFSGLELSPVTPLGTCSSLGPVAQNRVLATTRGTEVVSDLTNALAIEAAWRRRETSAPVVHLAACHRVLRMQPFAPQNSQHFQLFALVSTARDIGSGQTEARLIIEHLRFWAAALPVIRPAARFAIELTSYASVLMRERLHDTVLPALSTLPPTVTVSYDPAREHARGYYTEAAQRIVGATANGQAELGDGGLTTWTSQLLADAKERCLVSCISTERLAALG
jgi:hypothetical protein